MNKKTVLILAAIAAVLILSVAAVFLITSFGGVRYTVTFDTNGGSLVKVNTKIVQSAKVKEGEVIKNLENPIKSDDASGNNYEFKGWFTDPEFTEEWDVEKRAVIQDITLYAYWKLTE